MVKDKLDTPVKTERQRARDYADAMCSMYIRKKDPVCFQCGSTRNVQCGHLFPRGLSLRLRWDERNLWPQCKSCNDRHERNEKPMFEMVKIIKGEAWFEELRREMNVWEEFTNEDIREIGRKYKRMSEEL
jgi:5-methylcytosine-specific restriction endonuclease McrA